MRELGVDILHVHTDPRARVCQYISLIIYYKCTAIQK